MPLLKPFELRKAEDEHDAKLLGDVAEHGWHIVQIQQETDAPPFAFTVGLYYQFLQPEVLIMGLDLVMSAQILNDIGEAMRTGKELSAGRYSDFIDAFDIELAPIDLAFYEEYLGYGLWFYRCLPKPYPVMQCIWPDKQGLFPTETGYDTRFRQLQRLLTSNSEQSDGHESSLRCAP
jgi:hypothetical protein